jgi:hypothetical protein
MAFVKDDTAKAASLVANIQKLTETNKDKNLRSFVVFVGGPETKATLEKIAADKKISIPLTFLPGGPGQGDLGYYKISPEAKNTIMVYNRQKVHATFVDVDDKTFTDVEKATTAMLGG